MLYEIFSATTGDHLLSIDAPSLENAWTSAATLRDLPLRDLRVEQPADTLAATDKGTKMSALTPEQYKALEGYAAQYGRTWKSKLRDDWENARTAGELQELRNSPSFGPAGLISFRFDKPATASREHTAPEAKTPKTFRTEIEISESMIADLLCLALDRPGSWARCNEVPYKSTGMGRSDSKLSLPVAILDTNESAKSHTLDAVAIQAGIDALPRQAPDHLADILRDYNIDSTTGDVFLQLCIFGEVRYS